MPDVVALGDINIDIIAHFAGYPPKGGDALASSAEFHCGGSAANTALALARMGIDVTLIARLGPDPWATKALDSLREMGVRTTALQYDPAVMTGLMYVIVTPDGERTILAHRGANEYTDPALIREEDITRARLLHVSGYALLTDPQRSAALKALQVASRAGLTVALDPGMTISKPALNEMRAFLPVINLLVPSLEEARALTGRREPEDCVRALLEEGVKAVALKRGREGSLIGSGKDLFRVPAFSVAARDSTGAGDSFAAGIIAGLLGGLDWHSAAILGNAMGAIVATRVGAGTSVPRAQEVLGLLSEPDQAPASGEHVTASQRAIDFVRKLADKPETGRTGGMGW